MKTRFGLLCVTLVTASCASTPTLTTPSKAAPAAGPVALAGKWKFVSDINGDFKERKCTLQQQDAAFSGTCKNEEGVVQIAGTVNGDLVTFRYAVKAFGQTLPLTCTGKLSGSAMSGALTLGPLSGACYLTPIVTVTTFSDADLQCQSYLGRSFEGATVTKAELVAADTTGPETCVVRGEMPQDLDFEVRMPTDWNRRTVFIGAGGSAGSIGNRFISAGASRSGLPGYATIATNHGHNSNVTPGGTFALDVEMLSEYAHLAVPRVLASARAILRAQYGKDFDATKMVFEGCSGGGRQALIQAQRYPDLFDGVIARAPASAFIPQFLWYAKVAKLNAAPGGTLTPGKIAAIGAAVRAKCDGLDGLQDGIISRPELCKFDPTELACAAKESDSCLTPAQVATARGYYEPTNVGNGQFTWPGFMPGGEGPDAWVGTQKSLLDEFIPNLVAQNATTDALTIESDKHLPRLDYLSNLLDAHDPELHRFKAHGGKLILWTGQADWLITANNATDYYRKVVDAMGGQAAADEFVEYYISPDVQHCGGGAGPDQVDLVTPMFDWLEKGIKPASTTIVATKSIPLPAPMSRPLCHYPRYPKHQGGDTTSAANFTCALPDEK